MSVNADLTPAEWSLMLLIWRFGACSGPQLHKAVIGLDQRKQPSGRTGKLPSYTQIVTHLARMEAKGWVRVERGERHNIHLAAVDYHSAIDHRIQRFFLETLHGRRDLIERAIRIAQDLANAPAPPEGKS